VQFIRTSENILLEQDKSCYHQGLLCAEEKPILKADFHEANCVGNSPANLFFDFHAEANFGASFVTDKLHHDSKRKHNAIN